MTNLTDFLGDFACETQCSNPTFQKSKSRSMMMWRKNSEFQKHKNSIHSDKTQSPLFRIAVHIYLLYIDLEYESRALGKKTYKRILIKMFIFCRTIKEHCILKSKRAGITVIQNQYFKCARGIGGCFLFINLKPYFDRVNNTERRCIGNVSKEALKIMRITSEKNFLGYQKNKNFDDF